MEKAPRIALITSSTFTLIVWVLGLLWRFEVFCSHCWVDTVVAEEGHLDENTMIE
jgi:hypothetical protein